VLLQELLSSADRPERDQVLFERISKFKIPPYKTIAALSWEVINQGGIFRKEVADIFQAVNEQVAEAESRSLLARKPIGSNTRQGAKEKGT
jgi:hypothetical protein